MHIFSFYSLFSFFWRNFENSSPKHQTVTGLWNRRIVKLTLFTYVQTGFPLIRTKVYGIYGYISNLQTIPIALCILRYKYPWSGRQCNHFKLMFQDLKLVPSVAPSQVGLLCFSTRQCRSWPSQLRSECVISFHHGPRSPDQFLLVHQVVAGVARARFA